MTTTAKPACAPPHRLGGHDLAIAKAWTAVIKNERNAKALLDAVPAAARHDAGYIFARAQWLRRHDKIGGSRTAACLPPRKAPLPWSTSINGGRSGAS